CAINSAGTPSPVLYPSNKSFRKDSMTWSKAQATWDTPSSRRSDNNDRRMPRVAPTSDLSGPSAPGAPKCDRYSSYVPSIKWIRIGPELGFVAPLACYRHLSRLYDMFISRSGEIEMTT